VDAIRSGEMEENTTDLMQQPLLPTPWFLTPEAEGTPLPTVQPVAAPTLPSLRCTWPAGLVLGASGYVAVKNRRRIADHSEDSDGQGRA
jgi:hypothetical protein